MWSRRFSLCIAAGLAAIPLFAGALTLQIDNVTSNPEALAKHAIVAAHITACHSPEKTTVTGTAEGIVDGKRQSIPLRVMRLSEPGTFSVAREWPREGRWSVVLIATNPDYANYATSVVVRVTEGTAVAGSAKVFYHAPSAAEVNSVLDPETRQ